MCGLTREVNQLVINSRARLFTSTAAALAAALFLSGCGGAKSDEDGGSAVESCVDTSGDTDQDRVPQLPLRGHVHQREHRLQLAVAWRPSRSTPTAASSARRSRSSRRTAPRSPLIFAEKAEKLIQQRLRRRGLRRLDLVVAASPCGRSFESLNSILFYPVQYEGLEARPQHLLHGCDHQPADHPGARLPQEEKKIDSIFLAGSDYVFPRTANKIIKQYAAGERHRGRSVRSTSRSTRAPGAPRRQDRRHPAGRHLQHDQR